LLAATPPPGHRPLIKLSHQREFGGAGGGAEIMRSALFRIIPHISAQSHFPAISHISPHFSAQFPHISPIFLATAYFFLALVNYVVRIFTHNSAYFRTIEFFSREIPHILAFFLYFFQLSEFMHTKCDGKIS